MRNYTINNQQPLWNNFVLKTIHFMTELNKDQLRKIFHDNLNESSVDFLDTAAGIHSSVIIVQGKNKKYVVKVPVWEVKIFREVFAYQKWRSIIPLPKLYYYDSKVLIQSYIEGLPPNQVRLTPTEEKELYISLGQIITTMHDTQITGGGFIEMDGQASHSSFAEWVKSWLTENLHIWEKSSINESHPSSYIKQYIDIFLQANKLKPSNLLHYDLIDQNIRIDKSTKKITGIIDYGDLFAGPPEWDFVRPYIQHYGTDKFNSILAGYNHPLNIADILPLVIIEIAWALPYALEHDQEKLKRFQSILNATL